MAKKSPVAVVAKIKAAVHHAVTSEEDAALAARFYNDHPPSDPNISTQAGLRNGMSPEEVHAAIARVIGEP